MDAKSKLILFDIDWTLIRGSIPAHKDSFAYGFRKVYNIDASIDDAAPYEGKVDKQIIFEVLQKKVLDRNQIQKSMNEMFASMIEYAKTNFENVEISVLPGVEDALKAMKKLNCKLGVLTGNTKGIAEIKLSKSNLIKYFDVGAYGSEAERRVELIDVARERMKNNFGLEFAKENIYLVGDSLRDIQCGKDGGVKSIGIATGTHTLRELSDAGADFVLPNLAEYEKAIKFIFR